MFDMTGAVDICSIVTKYHELKKYPKGVDTPLNIVLQSGIGSERHGAQPTLRVPLGLARPFVRIGPEVANDSGVS
jgi:hypothetical protein